MVGETAEDTTKVEPGTTVGFLLKTLIDYGVLRD
jgi:hypothetical protein